MCPKLFNVLDSYTVMIIIGIVIAFIIYFLYGKKKIKNKQFFYSVSIDIVISVVIGFLGAFATQKMFDAIKGNITRDFPLTFYGGLVFGIITFFVIYFIFIRKKYKENLNQIFAIAPACICIAHSIGRIGCFMAGCCYGIETNSWLGVTFPGDSFKRYPTQLFEAIFLAMLGIILLFTAFKYDFKYNLVIYFFAYAIFRFLIEFIRGDERGAFLLNLSPSQWISIFIFLVAILLLVIFYKTKNVVKEDLTKKE